MTDPTAAAHEQVLDIVAQWDLHRPGDMKELLFSALMAAEQRGRDAEMEEVKRLVKNAETDTWFMSGLVQLLREHSIDFTSSDVIAAAGRVETRLKEQPAPEKNVAAAPQPKEPPRFSGVHFTQNGNATSKESDDE